MAEIRDLEGKTHSENQTKTKQQQKRPILTQENEANFDISKTDVY